MRFGSAIYCDKLLFARQIIALKFFGHYNILEIYMARKKLSTILRQKTGFVVTVELTGAPGFGFGPIEHFLKGYKELASSVPVGFDVVGLAIPQNPGGVANIEPLSILR